MGGRVYLVGAGPWDPGLLTLRGQTLLRRADTVIYDYLVNPEILQHTRADAKLVPTGRAGNRMSQTEICNYLVNEGRSGRDVVRLKGGDPFVFGRGGEEAEALRRAGLEFEVVPGVTAAIASCAYAGIPVIIVTYGSTLALCTGHSRDDEPDTDLDWNALASLSTVVFYMAVTTVTGSREVDRGWSTRRNSSCSDSVGDPGGPADGCDRFRWDGQSSGKTQHGRTNDGGHRRDCQPEKDHFLV